MNKDDPESSFRTSQSVMCESVCKLDETAGCSFASIVIQLLIFAAIRERHFYLNGRRVMVVDIGFFRCRETRDELRFFLTSAIHAQV